MSVKKITDLTELESANSTDVVPVVDVTNKETKKMQFDNLMASIVPKNAGAHNSIYRGKDITELWENGTLSKQIAAGTFDDIFIGDYITGASGYKYMVGHIDYMYKVATSDDTRCVTHHLLMVPDHVMGTATMNSTNITTGAYVGSELYASGLDDVKTIIKNDIGSDHILSHYNHFANTVTGDYESAGTWYESTIDLMNETMVYGNEQWHNIKRGANASTQYNVQTTQLAIFRLDPSFRMVKMGLTYEAENTGYKGWWLRDVAFAGCFCDVNWIGFANHIGASWVGGLRPAFLIY